MIQRQISAPKWLEAASCSLIIGKGGRRFSGDVKFVCPLTSSGEHGRKGAFVAFGNTEAFYRNMVVGHGPYIATWHYCS